MKSCRRELNLSCEIFLALFPIFITITLCGFSCSWSCSSLGCFFLAQRPNSPFMALQHSSSIEGHFADKQFMGYFGFWFFWLFWWLTCSTCFSMVCWLWWIYWRESTVTYCLSVRRRFALFWWMQAQFVLFIFVGFEAVLCFLFACIWPKRKMILISLEA